MQPKYQISVRVDGNAVLFVLIFLLSSASTQVALDQFDFSSPTLPQHLVVEALFPSAVTNLLINPSFNFRATCMYCI